MTDSASAPKTVNEPLCSLAIGCWGADGATAAAGTAWAPFAAFANAAPSDFDAIDRDGGGFITLEEFIAYVRAAEVARAHPPVALPVAGATAGGAPPEFELDFTCSAPARLGSPRCGKTHSLC